MRKCCQARRANRYRIRKTIPIEMAARTTASITAVFNICEKVPRADPMVHSQIRPHAEIIYMPLLARRYRTHLEHRPPGVSGLEKRVRPSHNAKVKQSIQ